MDHKRAAHTHTHGVDASSFPAHTKCAVYLFEGELDGLILAELQYIHELHDGLVPAVQLLLPLDQLFLLLGEVDELVQSFLVDVAVLLQLRVALLQLSEQLLKAKATIF